MDNPEFRNSQFYREFCAPQRLGYFAGANTKIDGSLCLRLTLQGDERRGQYEPEVLELMRGLLPHLRRAASINADILQLQSQTKAFSSVIDQGRNALIILDSTGTVLHANEAARAGQ